VTVDRDRVERALPNHFRLDRLLGTGGFGAVFKVYDTRADRLVAINALPVQDEGLVMEFAPGKNLPEQRNIPTGAIGRVLSLAFSPDGQTFAASDDSSVRLWAMY
jgi:WD40 repeat protein